jgi:hypothetical protein
MADQKPEEAAGEVGQGGEVLERLRESQQRLDELARQAEEINDHIEGLRREWDRCHES